MNGRIINLRFYCTGVAGDGSDDHLYEIALPDYVYGTNLPSNDHALLRTVDYTITSKGWGNEQVVNDGTTNVTLKSEAGGFKQTLIIYKQFTNNDRQKLTEFQNQINDAKAKIEENNKQFQI